MKTSTQTVKMKRKVKLVLSKPTKKDCTWVVQRLSERNPNFFEGKFLTHAERLRVMITMWMFAAQEGVI